MKLSFIKAIFEGRISNGEENHSNQIMKEFNNVILKHVCLEIRADDFEYDKFTRVFTLALSWELHFVLSIV